MTNFHRRATCISFSGLIGAQKIPLNPSQKRFLDMAERESRAAGFPFEPTEYWESLGDVFLKDITKNGILEIHSGFYNSRFHNISKDDQRLYIWFLTMFYNFLKNRDKLNLLNIIETNSFDYNFELKNSNLWEKSRFGTPVSIGKKLYYPDLLFSIYDFYNILEVDPRIANNPIIIGDVGAGWGRIGHVLRQVNPKSTYVVFDIPISLMISSTILPLMLPGSKVTSFEESRGSVEISRTNLASADCWFLGSHDLPRVEKGAIDIFINVTSFQEMTAEQVKKYLEIIDDRIGSGFVYLRNNAFSKFNLAGISDYTKPRRWRQIYSRPTIFSELIFEAAFAVE